MCKLVCKKNYENHEMPVVFVVFYQILFHYQFAIYPLWDVTPISFPQHQLSQAHCSTATPSMGKDYLEVDSYQYIQVNSQ